MLSPLKRKQKNSCHGGVLEVVVSMATWQMERVAYIASKVCDKLDKRLQSAIVSLKKLL